MTERSVSRCGLSAMPLVNFACYFPAEQPYFTAIKIELDAWVDQLLQAIVVNLKEDDREVRRKDLRIYQVNLIFLC